jgi:hypothetical protein
VAVIHLDPWTDIVNVNWPQTYTHVAFSISVGDSDYTVESYDYPAASPPADPGAIFSTSVKNTSQKVAIGSLYRMRTSGVTQVWSIASASDLVVSGYTLDGNTAQRFTKNFSECEHWVPIFGNRGPPTFVNNQLMLGFDGHRAQDSLITVPTAGSEKFETFTTAAMVYYSHPLTACVPTTENTTALDDNSVERVEIAANVIGGLSITYKGTACTVAGLWTPSLGLSPNVAIALSQVPKRMIVLATIDS